MSEEERVTILDWIESNADNFTVAPDNKRIHIFVKDATSTVTSTRAQKQILPPYTTTFPSCVWKIKERLIEKEKLHEYVQEPTHQDFIAVISTHGYIEKHKDENTGDAIHCRFNVFIELPKKGGETYYDGKIVSTKEREYSFVKSGFDFHWTNLIEEGRRISLSFGFLIPITVALSLNSTDI